MLASIMACGRLLASVGAIRMSRRESTARTRSPRRRSRARAHRANRTRGAGSGVARLRSDHMIGIF